MLTKFPSVNLLSNFSHWLRRFKQAKIRAFALLIAVGFSFTLALSACSQNFTDNSATTPEGNPSPTSQVDGKVVRIGYQKAATILFALKANKNLENALASSGTSVVWNEFPAGPPLLEAINSGSVDFGYTGEAPPVFAQAAGTPLLYVAYDPLSTQAEAIVVHKDSPIKTVADLKGKKVAFAKGSNTNYLVVKALEKAGLKYSDITPVFLTPADGRAAFEGKNVDAWAVWDPYLAAAEKALGARILTDATGVAPNRGYYLAAKSFVDNNPGGLKTVLDEVKKTSDWAKGNPTEVAKLLSPVLGIDAAVLETAEKRRDHGALPLTDEVITKQQEVADAFYKIQLIPKQVNVKDIVWQGK
ncbi:sulfonate ABC transporter substrate-binding protein [Calothrix sp. 336/3]|uniref:sulfonate ABC transporter substrate-binding protein n=1 Tax=Calothrix sp. 336/3 TaxID=1337936 RepID=UPI0004E3AF24|nr:sulfonate ABC transporter substrate-binding protein [Calothrix sp. 336/3]AKG21439.1 sulfonate ABC transporter substrate-binding protein [Calothrix sp. 336/3]